MKSLGVLTNIDANHGSCVFNFALNEILGKAFPGHEVEFPGYLTPSWYLYEILRAAKPHKKIPSYNLRRYLTLRRSSHENLKIVSLYPFFNRYDRLTRMLTQRGYDLLVVGKVVWDILRSWQTPQFPNIFWLSEEIPATKIAYAVSGHRTDMELFRQNKDRVLQILSSYALIGVRDDITLEMMSEAGVDKYVQVLKVPDPAFLFESRLTNVRALLTRHNIDLNRPILGLLFYGKPELSKAICDHYHNRGFQVINFNMYNPYADVNLGHIVDPFEWVELFNTLSFCITDRFHCSIFCIRKNVPFVAIEPYSPRTLAISKIYDLMKGFDLLDCYQDALRPDFYLPDFLSTCSHVEAEWQSSFSSMIQEKLAGEVKKHEGFIRKIQEVQLG